MSQIFATGFPHQKILKFLSEQLYSLRTIFKRTTTIYFANFSDRCMARFQYSHEKFLFCCTEYIGIRGCAMCIIFKRRVCLVSFKFYFVTDSKNNFCLSLFKHCYPDLLEWFIFPPRISGLSQRRF
jgi:hypothetical protein